MSIYGMYSSEAAFWEDFFIINKSSKQSRHIKWVEIVLKAQLKRQVINTEDAAKARVKYKKKSPDFNKVFVYRKGLKVVVYKGSLQIAQKYQKL